MPLVASPGPERPPAAVQHGERNGERPDPLVARALCWLGRRSRGSRPARQESLSRVAEDLAEALLAKELSRYAWLDVGLWGRPVYKAAAEAAVRLQAVAVTGDELG